MVWKEGIGLLTGIVVLAGVTFAIANGDKTARVMEAFGKSFGGIVATATGR